MGTRSLIHFVEGGETLATVYCQFDGSPSGRGQKLAEFLLTSRMTRGVQPAADGEARTANGLGCLAAQWIADEKHGPGNVYLHPPGDKDCGEDFTYVVEAPSCGTEGPIILNVLSHALAEPTLIYSGNVCAILFDGVALDEASHELMYGE
jgi:hypothetical protein